MIIGVCRRQINYVYLFEIHLFIVIYHVHTTIFQNLPLPTEYIMPSQIGLSTREDVSNNDNVPCEQWFLQAGRYATLKGDQPLRANVFLSERATVLCHKRTTNFEPVKTVKKRSRLAHWFTLINAALARACCEFALFQSLSRFFLPTSFAKDR